MIIDRYGRIRDVKTGRFPKMASHGCPRSKAKARRLEAFAKLLKCAHHHSVDTVVFENLLIIKKRYTESRSANRKIARFAKRATPLRSSHGREVRLQSTARLPKGTTKSKEHDEVMKIYGLDRHTASAYLIAFRGIERRSPTQKAKV